MEGIITKIPASSKENMNTSEAYMCNSAALANENMIAGFMKNSTGCQTFIDI